MALVVVFSNFAYLTITNQDPLIRRSGLQIVGKEQVLPGQNTIDPNDGFTSQALGVEAINQIANGKIPYWNHYEGIGFPLLGGMQSAALFPFTILLKLPGGSLVFHMFLEWLAAVGLYYLVKQLGFRRRVAIAAGSLFAINGTFVWLTNAAFNPIAFLPWLVFGIEKAREGGTRHTYKGWLLIALSLACSVYAGFPETAYLDGLLALSWAAVRISGLKKAEIKRYISSLVLGGAIGLLLSLPVLVAFIAYIPYAYVGSHASAAFGNAHLPVTTLPALLVPYIYGPIFTFAHYDATNVINTFWSNVGGYLGVGIPLLAGIGLLYGKKLKGLRVMLATWVLLLLARTYGMPGVIDALGVLPGMSQAAVFRYIMPTIEMASIILACFGVEALLRHQTNGRRRILFVGVVLLLGACMVGLANKQLSQIATAPYHQVFVLLSALMSVGVSVMVIFAMYNRYVWAVYAAFAAVALEAILLFMFPQFSVPAHSARVNTAPVQFLQENLGYERFFTLGPIAPNYGTYYHVASINDNDLPVPKLWAEYVSTKLDPGVEPILFMGTYTDDPNKSSKAEFLDHLEAYQDVSVKYVVAAKGQFTADEVSKYDLNLAYKDTSVAIYSLPSTRPYVSTTRPCKIEYSSRDLMKLNCSENTQLIRRELYFPGWQVKINGKTQTINKKRIFQTINIPKGQSIVEFSFYPPYILWAWIGFWIGAAGAVMVMLRVNYRKIAGLYGRAILHLRGTVRSRIS